MADIKKKAGHTMRIFGSDMPVVGEDEKTMVDARPRLTDAVAAESPAASRAWSWPTPTRFPPCRAANCWRATPKW